ncbi:MAG: hypothetical protein HFE59_05415 [Clostridiales bacterium]|nr:hypothetical protein [Clostridiales bacterium]
MAVFLIMSYVLSVSLSVGMFIWFFCMRDILKKEYLEAKRYCMLKKAIRKKILKSHANSRLGAGEREIEK